MTSRTTRSSGFGQLSVTLFVRKSIIRSEGMKLPTCRFNRATMIFARRKYRLVTARFEAESKGEVKYYLPVPIFSMVESQRFVTFNSENSQPRVAITTTFSQRDMRSEGAVGPSRLQV